MRKATTLQLSLGTLSFALAFCFATTVWAAYPKANQGTYIYAGGATEKKALQQAIEKIAKQASWFYRGAVRKALKKAFVIKKKVTLSLKAGDKLGIQVPGGKEGVAPLNGKRVTMASKKGPVYITRSFSGSTLKERLQQKGSKGFRKNRFVFSKDGKTMVMHSFVYLVKLKKNISFKLTYKRK